MKVPYIPKELVNIILEYDGRIKYRRCTPFTPFRIFDAQSVTLSKQWEYVNIISKNDDRYKMLIPIIEKKMDIMENIEMNTSGSGFYFQFGFDSCNTIGLCYDYNFSYENMFEICYYDLTNGWEQMRTYI